MVGGRLDMSRVHVLEVLVPGQGSPLELAPWVDDASAHETTFAHSLNLVLAICQGRWFRRQVLPAVHTR